MGRLGVARLPHLAIAMLTARLRTPYSNEGHGMFRSKYLIAICVLALTFGEAKADTYYDLVATFTGPTNASESTLLNYHLYPGLSYPLSVTITGVVDINNGIVQPGHLRDNFSPFPYNVFGYPGALAPDLYQFTGTGATSLPISTATFTIPVPDAYDLSNYLGGPISTATLLWGTQGCSGFPISCDLLHLNYSFVSGSLTMQTPLPSALPLFATGLAGLGLLGWRRKRKAASA
jgi:hypothetical protein